MQISNESLGNITESKIFDRNNRDSFHNQDERELEISLDNAFESSFVETDYNASKKKKYNFFASKIPGKKVESLRFSVVGKSYSPSTAQRDFECKTNIRELFKMVQRGKDRICSSFKSKENISVPFKAVKAQKPIHEITNRFSCEQKCKDEIFEPSEISCRSKDCGESINNQTVAQLESSIVGNNIREQLLKYREDNEFKKSIRKKIQSSGSLEDGNDFVWEEKFV